MKRCVKACSFNSHDILVLSFAIKIFFTCIFVCKLLHVAKFSSCEIQMSLYELKAIFMCISLLIINSGTSR